MAVLVTKWFGVFVVADGRVAKEERFPLVAREIAQRLLAIRRGEVLPEEQRLGGPKVEVADSRLRPLGKLSETAPFVELEVAEPDRKLLHEASLLVAREESRAAAGERDLFLVQSVRAFDEITKTANTLAERMREWYAVHFPEALARLPEASDLARQIAAAPHRRDVAQAVPALAGVDSIGADLEVPELEAIQALARNLANFFDERKRLEELIARVAREVAPRLSRVVGEVLAAKLIAQAGSLERLAHLPASTVQTLGAETALFQHLKERTKPPKHGVLFQNSLVNTAPWWQRGRISRVLAGAAAIAARLDHFAPGSGADAEALVARVEAQVARIRKRAKTPRPRRPEPRGPRRRAPVAAGARR